MGSKSKVGGAGGAQGAQAAGGANQQDPIQQLVQMLLGSLGQGGQGTNPLQTQQPHGTFAMATSGLGNNPLSGSNGLF